MGTKTDRLEEIRLEIGVNKSRYAEIMGISPHYYYHILSGKGISNLRLEHLENLLIHKGVNPAWIMTGIGEKFIKQESDPQEWVAGHLIPDLPIQKELDTDLLEYLITEIISSSGLPIVSSDLAYSICVNMCRYYIDKNPGATRDSLDISVHRASFLALLQTAQSLVGLAFEMQGDTVVIRFAGQDYNFVRQGQPDK